MPRRAPCRMIGDLVSADRNLGKEAAPLEGTLAARLAVLPLNVPPIPRLPTVAPQLRQASLFLYAVFDPDGC